MCVYVICLRIITSLLPSVAIHCKCRQLCTEWFWWNGRGTLPVHIDIFRIRIAIRMHLLSFSESFQFERHLRSCTYEIVATWRSCNAKWADFDYRLAIRSGNMIFVNIDSYPETIRTHPRMQNVYNRISMGVRACADIAFGACLRWLGGQVMRIHKNVIELTEGVPMILLCAVLPETNGRAP